MLKNATSTAYQGPLSLNTQGLAQSYKDSRYSPQETQRGHHSWKASNQFGQQTLLQNLDSIWECGILAITYQPPLSAECAFFF